MNFRRSITITLICLTAMFSLAGMAAAHCEIPCGIYDDKLRMALIAEHITTIEKSMRQIKALETQTPVNWNQVVRWVGNKETHAQQIQQIVTQYFMTQRIKPGAGDYGKKLAALHKLLVYARKCKQTVDTAHIATLREALHEFEQLYFVTQ